MERRHVLKLGASLGATAAAGLAGGWVLLPPRRSEELLPARQLAVRLFTSLDDETRAKTCVGYDHPARQYHNRGVAGCGLDVDLSTFDREQRRCINDLFHVGLSPSGRERLPRQYLLNWPGVHLMRLLICGDPRQDDWQVVLSGPHLNLRVGGRNREGGAFGGPLVYGDQRGNGTFGLPGNLYRDQCLAGQRVFDALSRAQRRAATVTQAPIQTRIEVQGEAGDFAGVRVGDCPAPARAEARALVAGLLSDYPEADSAYALECLEHNGGVDALSIAWFEQGEEGATGGQVFRLEGPGTVLYFRGHPHVHAFINIARDGTAPLSVGPLLGDNPRRRAGPSLAALFEQALLERRGTDLAYYPVESAVGVLAAGRVRSGDVWVAESWQDGVIEVEVRGSHLGPALRARLDGIDPARIYTVATTRFAAAERAAQIGGIEGYVDGGLLRDALVAHLSEHGFAPSG